MKDWERVKFEDWERAKLEPGENFEATQKIWNFENQFILDKEHSWCSKYRKCKEWTSRKEHFAKV